MTSPVPRAEWVAAMLHEVRLAGVTSTRAQADLFETLAGVVSRLPPPNGRFERLCANDLLQEMTYRVLRSRSGFGRPAALSADAALDLAQVVHVLHGTRWNRVAGRFRSLRQSTDRSVAWRTRLYVDTHFRERLTLPLIARALGVSARTMTAAFHHAHGHTVHAYLTRLRLAHAIQVLATTDHKISAVADMSGFRGKASLYRHLSESGCGLPRDIRRDPRARRSALILVGGYATDAVEEAV